MYLCTGWVRYDGDLNAICFDRFLLIEEFVKSTGLPPQNNRDLRNWARTIDGQRVCGHTLIHTKSWKGILVPYKTVANEYQRLMQLKEDPEYWQRTLEGMVTLTRHCYHAEWQQKQRLAEEEKRNAMEAKAMEKRRRTFESKRKEEEWAKSATKEKLAAKGLTELFCGHPRFVRAKELAEKLGASLRCVEEYAREGTIPGAYQSQGACLGEWRFRTDQLEAWYAEIAQGKESPKMLGRRLPQKR